MNSGTFLQRQSYRPKKGPDFTSLKERGKARDNMIRVRLTATILKAEKRPDFSDLEERTKAEDDIIRVVF